jgi:hypothetical protein
MNVHMPPQKSSILEAVLENVVRQGDRHIAWRHFCYLTNQYRQLPVRTRANDNGDAFLIPFALSVPEKSFPVNTVPRPLFYSFSSLLSRLGFENCAWLT